MKPNQTTTQGKKHENTHLGHIQACVSADRDIPWPSAAMSDDEAAAAMNSLPLEGPSLQRYAVRLSEVVMQQHAARKKDWKTWQGKEEELNDEIRELRRQVS